MMSTTLCIEYQYRKGTVKERGTRLRTKDHEGDSVTHMECSSIVNFFEVSFSEYEFKRIVFCGV